MSETNSTTAKICSNCKTAKSVEDFPKDSNRNDGRHPQCKGCAKIRLAKYYERNKEKAREARRVNYAENKDRYIASAIKWAAENKEKRRAISKRYVKNNPETRYATQTANRLANPGMYAAHFKMRQQRKRQAMPAWADPIKIGRIYKACSRIAQVTGIKHHVDHYFPLKSDVVCGLHNEFNLRIITAFDNLSKSNTLLE